METVAKKGPKFAKNSHWKRTHISCSGNVSALTFWMKGGKLRNNRIICKHKQITKSLKSQSSGEILCSFAEKLWIKALSSSLEPLDSLAVPWCQSFLKEIGKKLLEQLSPGWSLITTLFTILEVSKVSRMQLPTSKQSFSKLSNLSFSPFLERQKLEFWWISSSLDLANTHLFYDFINIVPV